MKKKKAISATMGISVVLIIVYLVVISVKKQSTINAMNTLSISVNGYEITLKNEGKYNSLNVGQLSTTTENTLSLNEKDKVESIKINDKEEQISDEIHFNVDAIDSSEKIKISIKYSGEEEYSEYYINTYSTTFPGYEVRANSPYEGEYYLTTHNEDQNYVFKLDNDGDLIFYKAVESNPFDFKKIVTEDNEIRYGYLVVDSTSTRISGVGYSPTKLVIMDENYNEINTIKMSEYEDIEEGTSLENHDFIYLDDNHYILSSYQVVTPNNIPEELSNGNKTEVVAQVLQEVKDDEVIWQWISTDYEEFYYMSEEDNTFSEENETALDYIHFNSITIDPSDNNFICSFRNTDSVVKLDRESGEIIWILGGKYDDFGLTEEQLFSRQHHARVTEEGYLTIYDNGVENEDSRAIKIKIDEKNKTVVDFKEYDVDDYYKYTGSVQELDSDNEVYLIGLGTQPGVNQDLVAMEKNYSTGEVYFTFSFNSGANMYRCYKFE